MITPLLKLFRAKVTTALPPHTLCLIFSQAWKVSPLAKNRSPITVRPGHRVINIVWVCPPPYRWQFHPEPLGLYTKPLYHLPRPPPLQSTPLPFSLLPSVFILPSRPKRIWIRYMVLYGFLLPSPYQRGGGCFFLPLVEENYERNLSVLSSDW